MNKEIQKTIVVTGGSGFIGGMVCRLLVDAGHNVINIDRVKKSIPGVTQYPFDINNNQLKGVLELTKPDAVIHLAADHEVGRSVSEPDIFYKNNVANTIDLLNACVETNVKHFIYSSSSSVYGDVLVFPTTEELSMNPVSPYGRTKAMVETILKDYSNAHDITFTALRYFNAAGADPEGEHGYVQDPASHIIPILCRKVLNDEVFTINGNDYETADGTCQRDYTHVSDIASAHLFAMNYLLDGGKSTSFNIGRGDSNSILEVIKAFEDINNVKLKTDIGTRRAGDPAITYAGVDKAKELLGWEPQYTLEDICKHAFEWENNRK
tara:strand:+ start:1807 stop:2775 length:969 start_codon:yes stop_codon:yes gene_type:complete